MRSVVLAVGLCVFAINPSFACGSAEPEYQYGGAELRAAIEGTWLVHITRSDHSSVDLTLQLAQQTVAQETASGKQTGPSLVRGAHACGTRTLIASAGACVDTTEMPLDVTFVEGDSALDAAVAGIFRVDSLVFTTGMLELALGEFRIRAAVDADGNVTSSALIAPLGGTAALGHVFP